MSRSAGSALWRSLALQQQLVGANEALERIGFVGGDRHDHHRHPVPERALLLLGAHRHRHHGHERLVGQLVALDQPLPQGRRAQAHHHVVHGDGGGVLDRLDGVEREPPDGQAAVGRDLAVEERGGRPSGGHLEHVRILVGAQCLARACNGPGERGHAREGVGAGQVDQIGQRGGDRAQGPQRLVRQAEHAAAEHLQLTGRPLAAAVRRGRRDLPPLGARVEQDGEQLVARYAVHRRVVDLGQQRHATTLEPVDQVQLPQRPAAVQRAGEDAGHDLGQAVVVARRRDSGLADVEVEIEVRVLDPVGQVEAERNLGQAPLEHGQQVKPLADQAADVLCGKVAAGGGGRVVHRQASDMPVGPGVLHAQELGIQAGELAHGDILPLAPPRWNAPPVSCAPRSSVYRGPGPRSAPRPGPCRHRRWRSRARAPLRSHWSAGLP